MSYQERMTSEEFQRRHGNAPIASGNKPQIRIPKVRKMNKTEAGWQRELERRFDPALYRVRYEHLSIKLPHGTRYCPDFVVIEITTGRIVEIWETKGGYLHGSAAASKEKWKSAKDDNPQWKFGFAQLLKGEWHIVTA
jgi:hypothetical protein